MCGIAGAYGSYALERVRACATAIRHRGPEATATYADGRLPFALAHCRLSIIDHSASAAQPMRYADRYVLVHNGEVYNYLELRKALQEKGFPFQSRSDSEVILAAYACWGEQCVHHFDGAFAFAIWDEQEQSLFAARDRMGEKPFFYSVGQQHFTFASELKALWQSGCEKKVDAAMAYNYLTLGYTTNPLNRTQTFYRHLYQLPPAHYLRWKPGMQEVAASPYWQVHGTTRPCSEQDSVPLFQQLLRNAVSRRLRSDVQVGISLSGGLDSSTIAAICAQQQAGFSGHAFTASFPNSPQDERSLAAQVARHCKLQHHIIPVSATDLLQGMAALHRHQEAPVQSASVLAQWQVYAAAKRAGITVLLDGQGADELLAGYHKYYLWYWRELYAARRLRASGERTAATHLGVSTGFGLQHRAAALCSGLASFLWRHQVNKHAAGNPFLAPEFVAANKQQLHYSQPRVASLNGVLHFNTFTLGLEELLRYADRNSMAHAVEVRLPFLDHQLVEFLFALPACFKIRNGWTKWLLRQSMQHMLPQNIVWRKDKLGFEPPQQQWMQEPAVQQAIVEARSVLVAEGILRPSALQQPVVPRAAHAADNMDWRCWSLSHLYR